MTTVDVVFITWPVHRLRIESFQRCVGSWQKNLLCDPGDSILWHCSTETERCNEQQIAAVREVCKGTDEILNIRCSQRSGPADQGSNLNTAMRNKTGDFIIMVQDDFPLIAPLNVSNHCRFLSSNPEVACVRYGWKHTNFTEDIPGTDLQWVDLGGPYPYAHEPALMRGTWEAEFGAWPENEGHAAPENQMVSRMRKNGRPIAATREEIAIHHGCPSCLPERWTEAQRALLEGSQ